MDLSRSSHLACSGEKEELLRLAGLTRREFLWFSALSTLAVAAGCAVDPVTGKQQVMMVSEDKELLLDSRSAPHLFSNDFGQTQDSLLAAYINEVGMALVPHTHRPKMPYRFLALNNSTVNAYTLPAGSMGVLRGLFVHLKSEAELAFILGHELGHVSARHTAEAMTASSMTQLALIAATEYAGQHGVEYEALTYVLGLIASQVLLAKYSRNNEREADALGLEYTISAGYNPRGAVEVMGLLAGFHRSRPSFVDLMFATHPMSEERYRTAVEKVKLLPPSLNGLPLHRERFMDNTAGLRALKIPIEMMQNGDREMHAGNLSAAEDYYRQALRQAPADYAALLKMARCMGARSDYAAMKGFADEAKSVYPGEPQAHQVSGVAGIMVGKYEAALEDITYYGKKLRGNPYNNYFKALALDGMGRKEEAVQRYAIFLNVVTTGDHARNAVRRLKELKGR